MLLITFIALFFIASVKAEEYPTNLPQLTAFVYNESSCSKGGELTGAIYSPYSTLSSLGIKGLSSGNFNECIPYSGNIAISANCNDGGIRIQYYRDLNCSEKWMGFTFPSCNTLSNGTGFSNLKQSISIRCNKSDSSLPGAGMAKLDLYNATCGGTLDASTFVMSNYIKVGKCFCILSQNENKGCMYVEEIENRLKVSLYNDSQCTVPAYADTAKEVQELTKGVCKKEFITTMESSNEYVYVFREVTPNPNPVNPSSAYSFSFSIAAFFFILLMTFSFSH